MTSRAVQSEIPDDGARASRPTRITGRAGQPQFSRRALIAAGIPVAAAAIGATASIALQWQQRASAPQVPEQLPPKIPATVDQFAATPIATASPTFPPATPAPVVEVAPVATPLATSAPSLVGGLPPGMALVTSPRLALASVGREDVQRLLTGSVADWREVGSAVSIPVVPMALRGESAGVRAEQAFASMDELAAALFVNPGAVALLPLELVDFRVQALAVEGEDPLRQAIEGTPAVRIGVVGDIVPGRNVHLHMAQYGDFSRPFRRVAPLLQSFDLMVANLEGNISDTLPQPADPHSFSFVSNTAMLEGFALAGIDAVTLANNHSVWNSEGWGVQGLLDTLDALEAAEIAYFGAGRTLDVARAAWVQEVNGLRIALLGIDGVTANYEVEPGVQNGVLDFDAGATADRPGTNPYLLSQVLDDISAATAVADVVIPYFHFGAEYVAVPPAWAVAGAQAAIDAGATMVVSNHPHVNQGMETYAGKPIVYSPGNFIFDQMFAVEVRSGYVLEIVLHGANVTGLRYHGVEIEDFHQPRPMDTGEQAALMDRFWTATDRRIARDGATG
ncbi:MAG: CapA family protein [Thermomicrobiales bacterium]